jgi:hypothetical protein
MAVAVCAWAAGLDALLAEAGLDLAWDAALGDYRSPTRPASRFSELIADLAAHGFDRST